MKWQIKSCGYSTPTELAIAENSSNKNSCRQAISTLFNAFLIFIATNFNLNLTKFAKSHYLFEFNRRQTIFLEINCLELYK